MRRLLAVSLAALASLALAVAQPAAARHRWHLYHWPIPAHAFRPIKAVPATPPAASPPTVLSYMPGRAQTVFTITDTAGLSPVRLSQIEEALVMQAAQVSAYWSTGTISFGPGGIPLAIEPMDQVAASCQQVVVGCHGASAATANQKSQPWIAVGWDGSYDSVSQTLSHEVVEVLVDPHGSGLEVCDPLESYSYLVNGQRVADFLEPDGSDFAHVR